MENIQHKNIEANGIKLHIADIGEPTKGTILFLHGFPELWYTWRHQLLAVSQAGYRAIAPDLRGYGDSDAPQGATNYTSFHIVGDLVALIDGLGLDKVYLVGHDWGAIIAWHFCLLRPDKIIALVNLSVPFSPRNPAMKPIDGFRRAFGDDFYMVRFQEPGEIESEFDTVDTALLLKNFLASRDPNPPRVPKGKLAEAAPALKNITLPPWLTEDDINYIAGKFKQTGFTGSLNYYRAMDLTWELMAPWTGVQVKVPVKFVVGELDITYNFPHMKDYMLNGGFKRDVPLLDDIVVIEDAAHFIHQEKPQEISNIILDYFCKF